MPRTWLLLLPELRRIPPQQQTDALREAGETPLDLLELLALALALAVAAGLTRYDLVDATATSRLVAALVNFAVAVPLIAACAAPVHVRRLRRGLRRQAGPHGHE